MEVEEAIGRHKSIRNWFIKPNGERRYEPSTERVYIKRMEIFCDITGKTPDELANCEDIDRMRGIIAEGLKEEFVTRRKRIVIIRVVGLWINALNSFWKHNGRQVTDTYGGIPKHLRRKILTRKRLRRNSVTAAPENTF